MRPFSPETPPEANRFTRFGKKIISRNSPMAATVEPNRRGCLMP